jgi:hypothetical protein
VMKNAYYINSRVVPPNARSAGQTKVSDMHRTTTLQIILLTILIITRNMSPPAHD